MEFTLGIEEEYQVIDPGSRDLKPQDQKLVDTANSRIKDVVKAEMHQAVVEIGTPVCKDIVEARENLIHIRQTVCEVAGEFNLLIGASGTHPFSEWEDQLITDHPRYEDIVNELQDAARSNLIFGMHVHVGIPDRELAVHIANSVRYFLPHIFALSTNSPFWQGRNTGFKSYRSKVFDKFPRTGIPDFFDGAAEYDKYVNVLVKTNCIDNAKKIWWDIRVHPFYPTLEFRICDVPLTLDESIAITALIQAIVAKLYRLREQNLNFMTYKRPLLNENKWRACRYGIDGHMIDFGKESEVNTKVLILELLDFVDEVVDELGSRKELEYIPEILEKGTGADRQLAVFEETKSLEKVVDYVVEQTNPVK